MSFLEKRVGHQNTLVLGHSEGSILAVELAHLSQNRVKGLILIGAQARSMKEMLYYQVVESRTKASSGIGGEESPEKEYEKALKMITESNDDLAPDGKLMQWYKQHFAAPSNASRLGMLKTKTAIFQGEIDPQTPISEIDIFMRSVPETYFTFYTGDMVYTPLRKQVTLEYFSPRPPYGVI